MLLQPLAAARHNTTPASHPLAQSDLFWGLMGLIDTCRDSQRGRALIDKVAGASGPPGKGGGEYQRPQHRARRLNGCSQKPVETCLSTYSA